jgi:hypothetical protein
MSRTPLGKGCVAPNEWRKLGTRQKLPLRFGRSETPGKRLRARKQELRGCLRVNPKGSWLAAAVCERDDSIEAIHPPGAKDAASRSRAILSAALSCLRSHCR